MFTSYDKAWVALIGAIIFIVSKATGWQLGWITPEMIENAVPFITAFFVTMVPNKGFVRQ